MLTLAHHADGAITGRVCYLDGVTRADLLSLLPMLGGPVPIDAARGVITESVFCFNARVHGAEVPLAELFTAPRVEVAPGIWAAAGTPGGGYDPTKWRD